MYKRQWRHRAGSFPILKPLPDWEVRLTVKAYSCLLYTSVKKFYRRTFLVIYDIISVILASYLALMIRYGFSLAEIPEHFMKPITDFLPFSIVITLIVLYIFRMYNSLWAYAGETELQNLICACIISSALQAVGLQFFRFYGRQACLLYTSLRMWM